MVCYWFKDCRGKEAQGFEATKFIQVQTVEEAIVHNGKESFKCFEVTHKPTKIRMIEEINKEVIYGEWR